MFPVVSGPEARSPAAELARVEGATVRFRGREVLSGACLVVHRGEIVTLIGPNGAGKTTLLRVVLGLLAPEAGSARIRAGVRIGYMPQRIALDGALPLTVRRFLQLAGGGVLPRIETVAGEVGASLVLDAPLQSVSGGELQRVLLARALLRDPDLLILDEPVQGVDVQGQVELFGLITRLRDHLGCGVLMVSHDLHLVMAKTDRIVCLDRSIRCTGTPASVICDPAYQALFSGAAAAGLVPYTHRHDAEPPCCPPGAGEGAVDG